MPIDTIHRNAYNEDVLKRYTKSILNQPEGAKQWIGTESTRS